MNQYIYKIKVLTTGEFVTPSGGFYRNGVGSSNPKKGRIFTHVSHIKASSVYDYLIKNKIPFEIVKFKLEFDSVVETRV